VRRTVAMQDEAETSTKERVVEMTHDGQTLCVAPAPHRLVDALRTRRLVAGQGGRHGYHVRPKREPLCEVWPFAYDTELRVPAGLEPVVRLLLCRHGHAVRIGKYYG